MTLEITVRCDAWDCHNEVEVTDNHDSAIEAEGWVISPDCGYTHYCPKCWPTVKKEMEKQS